MEESYFEYDALLGSSANETIYEGGINERMINGTLERAVTNFELALITVTIVTGYIYVLLTIVGIALNAYVLFWLTVLACKDRDRFIHGCGMPLAAMSLADMLSLISIVVTVLFAAFFPPDFITDAMRTAQCKVALFLIHTMTGVSTWCWLFVSALRYMAVYHPLWHISRWRLGQRSITAILIASMGINSWLLIAVVGFPNTCAETPFTIGGLVTNRWLHAIDLCWSYIIPGVITGTLDIRVLLTQPPGLARSLRHSPLSAANQTNNCNNRVRRVITTTTIKLDDESMDQTQTEPQAKASTATTRRASSECLKKCSPISQGARARTAVWHWLAITTIDLLLNTPDNTMRLMSVVGVSTSVEPQAAPYYHLAAVIARLFYFAQFCFNAAYLSTVVYKRNVQPRRAAAAPPASAANRNSSLSKFPADTELIALQSIVQLGQIHLITQSASTTNLQAGRISTINPQASFRYPRHHSLDRAPSPLPNGRSASRRRGKSSYQTLTLLLNRSENGNKRSFKRKTTPSKKYSGISCPPEMHPSADRTSSL